MEDEMLVALFIEDMLIGMGFEVVGPAMRLQRALKMANEDNIDFAILDVNLANERSFPVARVLQKRDIPFIFATGYGSQGLDKEFKGTLTLQKPFEPHQLERAVSGALT